LLLLLDLPDRLQLRLTYLKYHTFFTFGVHHCFYTPLPYLTLPYPLRTTLRLPPDFTLRTYQVPYSAAAAPPALFP